MFARLLRLSAYMATLKPYNLRPPSGSYTLMAATQVTSMPSAPKVCSLPLLRL